VCVDLTWMLVGSWYSFKPNQNTGVYLIGEGPVKAYDLFNFAAAYKVNEALRLNLGIENVLNKTYYPSISQFYGSGLNYARGNGRRFNLAVGYAF
jgi:iron complex outermembrane receptor protein